MLIVAAFAEELQHLSSAYKTLITGPGKLRSAVALADQLRHEPDDLVINIGTCGALTRDFPSGVIRIGAVLEHDFDSMGIRQVTNHRFGRHQNIYKYSRWRLASGDRIISDTKEKQLLSIMADAVDMEGFAVAYTAQSFGAECRIYKVKSDNADESAFNWTTAVDGAAKYIADFIEQRYSL